MFSSRFIAVACFIFICATAVFSQEATQQKEPDSAASSGRQFGIFMDLGFGLANNLRLSDWMNRVAEGQELFLLSEEDESTRKEPLIYGGVDIEARFFSGNLVFGSSFGYYDVSQGYREVQGDLITYKQRLSLSFIALKASAYYKISFDTRPILFPL